MRCHNHGTAGRPVARGTSRWEAIRVRLATWNVNSVKARLPRLLEWLAGTGPDVVCLQETKVAAALFPAAEVGELGTRSQRTATAGGTAWRCCRGSAWTT